MSNNKILLMSPEIEACHARRRQTGESDVYQLASWCSIIRLIYLTIVSVMWSLTVTTKAAAKTNAILDDVTLTAAVAPKDYTAAIAAG